MTQLAPDPQAGARRDRLRDLIAERSFKEGEFTLASGKRSNVFIDLKQTMLDHEGLDLLAEEVLEQVKDVDADFIGGIAMGAVPIVLGVVLKSHASNRPLNGFWVRKGEKDHGTRARIDGPLKPESNVIVVDDVTTTGGSLLKAVDAVEEIGCRIRCVLTVVDRCEGAKKSLEARGATLVSLFDRYDFTSEPP